MNDLHPGSLFALLALLLGCSALLSAAEIALFNLDRQRTLQAARDGHRGAARVGRLLSRPNRLLGTLLIANTLARVLAASLATFIALRLWGEPGIAMAVLALTLCLLLFAEITPRTLATLYPERLAYAVSLPLSGLQAVSYPLLWLLNGISFGVLKLFGVDASRRRSEALTTEALRNLVRESGQSLPENRQHMLLGILDLETVTVNDIMIPRNEVFGIDLEADMEQIIDQLRSTTHTRLPLYRHDINQVEGIIHMRQIARLLTHNQLSREDLAGAAHPPYFIPESTPLSTQLINFQKEKRRIGIVVDEYGEVLGIATLEDILEEIVGDFSNQDSLRSPDIHPQDDGTQVIDGAAYVREINRSLSWQLPCDGPKTLNGLITEALESIPESPVCLKIGPYRLEILQSAENRVKSVRVWQAGVSLSADAPEP